MKTKTTFINFESSFYFSQEVRISIKSSVGVAIQSWERRKIAKDEDYTFIIKVLKSIAIILLLSS